jgi:5-methylcytosine-specific restriction endonuclease McrA
MGKGLCPRCYQAKYRKEHASEIAASKRAWHKRERKRMLARQKVLREEKAYDGRREAVLERDRYQCVKCRTPDQLVVHHKDGNGRGSKRPNNEMSNLETLCRACHAALHNVVDWARGFERCQQCGTTERRHNAKGLCWKCYRATPRVRSIDL